MSRHKPNKEHRHVCSERQVKFGWAGSSNIYRSRISTFFSSPSSRHPLHRAPSAFNPTSFYSLYSSQYLASYSQRTVSTPNSCKHTSPIAPYTHSSFNCIIGFSLRVLSTQLHAQTRVRTTFSGGVFSQVSVRMPGCVALKTWS